MGWDSSDEDDGGEADTDLELKRKVAMVIAPLMKKLRKQSKRIEALEELTAKNAAETTGRIPALESDIRAQATALEDAMERTRRDLGERVLHAEHARVEVSLGGSVSAMTSTVEDLRTRLAQHELQTRTLTTRLEEAEAAARRGVDAVEERIATLRASMGDEAVRADTRRSELQLQLSEMGAKLHGELVEMRRAIDDDLRKLGSASAAAARRDEVVDRFGGLEEAMGSAKARADRQETAVAALEQSVAQAQTDLHTRAAASDLHALRSTLDAQTAAAASSSALDAAVHDAASREAHWEARHRAVEVATANSMRELRQMSANLGELAERLGERALSIEVDDLRGRLDQLAPPLTMTTIMAPAPHRASYFAAAEHATAADEPRAAAAAAADDEPRVAPAATAIAATAAAATAAAEPRAIAAAAQPRAVMPAASGVAVGAGSLEALRAELAAQAAQMRALSEETSARLEASASAERMKRLEGEVRELGQVLAEKVGVSSAEKMLAHKADVTSIDKLRAAAHSANEEQRALHARIEAAESALHAAKRDAADAIEQARNSSATLSQLQGATDRHWQITRTSREEQAQLVKAIRALLLDAELRTSSEGAASQAAQPNPHQTRVDFNGGEYGMHGWASTPAARHGQGRGGAAAADRGAKSLPRVAVAAAAVNGGSGSTCASPQRVSVAQCAPWAEPIDPIARRRRALAGASLGACADGGVTLPVSLALPGSQTAR